MANQGSEKDVIDQFIKHYKFTHYDALAQRVKEICEEEIQESGEPDIPKLVTCRAKDKSSRRKKIENINEKRKKNKQQPFQTEKEIESSIFDLAGVRVALYVPSQKQRVRQRIEELFDLKHPWKEHRRKLKDEEYVCKRCGWHLEQKVCSSCQRKYEGIVEAEEEAEDLNDTDEGRYPVFAGYVADHARVKLRADDVNRKKLLDLEDHHVVEIQVSDLFFDGSFRYCAWRAPGLMASLHSHAG
jgi:ppGpp synthetase/RelA/SpoT-type nucleotidyltranferase